MIDLSNVNVRPGGPQPHFKRLHEAGQRRLLLKVTQGAGFVDPYFATWLRLAGAAGLRVGGYHYAEPHKHTPREEALHFIAHAHPKALRCRPVLDLEEGAGSPTIGRWAEEWLDTVHRETGLLTLLYSYSSYVSACRFRKVVAPLWLASYGRNDGREHPFTIPRPWKRVAAHQYASTAKVAGVAGRVDISHVFYPRSVDVR